MRRNLFLVLLIIISLTVISCKDDNAEPIETTTTAKQTETTTKAVTEDPTSPEDSLPAIIENLKNALVMDYEEYEYFVSVLDGNDLTSTTAYQKFETLYNELQNKNNIKSTLTSIEENYITELGMDIDSYNGIFNNFSFLHNTRISLVASLMQNIEDTETTQEYLADIVEFYRQYNKLFQMDLYYSVNLIINDCKIENDSITEFKEYYSTLISKIYENMQWEDDNDVIDILCQEIYEELNRITNEFTEKYNLTEDE